MLTLDEIKVRAKAEAKRMGGKLKSIAVGVDESMNLVMEIICEPRHWRRCPGCSGGSFHVTSGGILIDGDGAVTRVLPLEEG